MSINAPPRYIVYAGGRRQTNPAWVAYQEAKDPSIAQKKEAAAKAFAEAGVEIKSPGVLDRTVADIRSGKSKAPTSQLNPEQRQQLLTAQLRDEARAGNLSVEEYQRKLSEITGGYEKESGERTERLGRIAQVAGRSETAKQDEARAIAAQQGVAIGTVGKSGTANVSANSIEFKNMQVSEFVNAQKNQMAQQAQVTQAQQKEKVTVTTPDGRERTFKNLETAEKFVKRTEGSYVKEVQGPIQSTRNYLIELQEGGKQQEFRGPYENLTGTFGKQQPTFLGSAIESGLKSLDEFTSIPLTSKYGWLVEPFKHPAGFLKESLAGVGFLSNLGTYTGAWLRGRETPITKPIDIVDTSPGIAINQLMQGKNPLESKELKQYLQKYGASTVMGEVSTFYPGTSVKSLSPLKGKQFSQPGVTISKNVISGKTAISTPAIVSKEIGVKTVSLGYGTKTKSIISSVGGKINLGSPKLDDVTVQFTATTGKQVQRGVKLAADSSQFEQKLSSQLIQKSTISKGEKEKAAIIEELVDLTTSKKSDIKTAESLGGNAFENVTPTEQPSFIGALSKGQKRIINPIGKFEGSLSQSYFVLPKFMRKAGDVDLHASTYGKAAKQVDYITPKIEPDLGRKFFGVTSEKTKSAKVYVGDIKTGKQEKVIEILNPEEKDLEGVLQSVEGETLFGKKIPGKTYKVEEGKTYGRQRQILKKGESLYSIQSDNTLNPAPFRLRKDVSDFYALIESARVVEFVEGTKESKRISDLLGKFRSKYETDNFKIDEFLAQNKQPEKTTLNIEPSTIQKIGSTTASQSGKIIKPTPSIKETQKPETESSTQSQTENKISLVTRSISTKPKIVSMGSLSRTRYTPTRESTTSINRIQRGSTSLRSITSKAKPPSITQSSLQTTSISSMLSIDTPSTGKSITGNSLTGKSLGEPKTREPRVQKMLRLSGPSDTKQLSSYTQKRRVIIPGIILLKNTTKKAVGIFDKSHNFLGWTKVAEIGGARTTTKDIDVGDKRTAKLYQEDILGTKKRYKKSDKVLSKNLLGSRNTKIRLI